MVDQVTLQEQEHALTILTLDSLPYYYVEENPFKSTGQCSPIPCCTLSCNNLAQMFLEPIALKKGNCAWGLRAEWLIRRKGRSSKHKRRLLSLWQSWRKISSMCSFISAFTERKVSFRS